MSEITRFEVAIATKHAVLEYGENNIWEGTLGDFVELLGFDGLSLSRIWYRLMKASETFAYDLYLFDSEGKLVRVEESTKIRIELISCAR